MKNLGQVFWKALVGLFLVFLMVGVGFAQGENPRSRRAKRKFTVKVEDLEVHYCQRKLVVKGTRVIAKKDKKSSVVEENGKKRIQWKPQEKEINYRLRLCKKWEITHLKIGEDEKYLNFNNRRWLGIRSKCHKSNSGNTGRLSLTRVTENCGNNNEKKGDLQSLFFDADAFEIGINTYCDEGEQPGLVFIPVDNGERGIGSVTILDIDTKGFILQALSGKLRDLGCDSLRIDDIIDSLRSISICNLSKNQFFDLFTCVTDFNPSLFEMYFLQLKEAEGCGTGAQDIHSCARKPAHPVYHLFYGEFQVVENPWGKAGWEVKGYECLFQHVYGIGQFSPP